MNIGRALAYKRGVVWTPKFGKNDNVMPDNSLARRVAALERAGMLARRAQFNRNCWAKTWDRKIRRRIEDDES